MFDFKGQKAVITGGASGIGYEIANLLSQHGVTIYIADINEAAARDAADRIRYAGGEVHHAAMDVADSASVDAVFDTAHSQMGGLDILVHSAGVGIERPFLDTSDEEWRRLIDIDLTGSFYCNRAAGRLMAKAKYGRIVNLSSTAGVVGGSGRAAYGAAKGGVIMLTRVLAVELAEKGVTVNALAPGAIETELVAKMHSPLTRQVYRRAIPQDRYGTPLEVAYAAVFLASRESCYVTGHVLAVDGGFLAAGVLQKS